MKKQQYTIVEIVEKKGYKYEKNIGTWIQGILRKKEDFEDYIVETEMHQDKNAIFKIVDDGVILVENLYFLYPYKSLFGRATGKSDKFFPLYNNLKTGDFKSSFEQKIVKKKVLLDRETKRNLKAISGIEVFYTVLKNIADNDNSIDITKESLIDLINSTNSLNKIPELDSPLNQSTWMELVELKEKIEKDGDDEWTLLAIAEKYLLLNEEEKGIDKLYSIVEIYPEHGSTWALLADRLFKQYQRILQKMNSHHAMNDYSGPIDYPLDGEEHHYNELLEDYFTQSEEIRKEFVRCIFKALEFWPHWSEHKLDNGKNYHPTTAIGRVTDFEIKREELFTLAIKYLENKDFKDSDYTDTFSTTLCSISRSKKVDLPSFHYNRQNLPIWLKIIKIYSWTDKDVYNALLLNMVDKITNGFLTNEESRYTLQSSEISDVILSLIGIDKFQEINNSIQIKQKYQHDAIIVSKILEHYKNSIFDKLDTIKPYLIKYQPTMGIQEVESYTTQESILALKETFLNITEECKSFNEFYLNTDESLVSSSLLALYWLVGTIEFISNIKDNKYPFSNSNKDKIESIAEGLKTFSSNEERIIGNAIQKELDKLPKEQWIKDLNICRTDYLLKLFTEISEETSCDKVFAEHLELIWNRFYRYEDDY